MVSTAAGGVLTEYVCYVDGWRIGFKPADPLGWSLEERDEGTEDYRATAWFLSAQDAEQWLIVVGFPRVAREVGRMVRDLVEQARTGASLPAR